MLLSDQPDIDGIIPMPTDRVDDTSVVLPVSSETLTWLYLTGGAWGSATGQAAGTIVYGKTVYDGILNSSKSALGGNADTSVSFAAATRAAQRVSIPSSIFARVEKMTPTNQKAEMTKHLTVAGDYAVDHRRGRVWANMKATVADDSITYSVKATTSGGGTGDAVNIIKVGGDTVGDANVARTTATNVIPTQPIDEAGNVLGRTAANTARTTATLVNPGQLVDAAGRVLNTPTVDSVAGATDTGVAALFVRDDTLTALTPIDGDYVQGRTNANGAIWVTLADLLSFEDQTSNVGQMVMKPLAVSTYTCTRDSSTALEASSISKASAGNLYQAFGNIDATAPTDIYYVLFLDSATLTGDGAVTHLRSPEVVVHTNGTDSSFDTLWCETGIAAANGIVIVLSTTMVTKTIVTGSAVALFATTLTK